MIIKIFAFDSVVVPKFLKKAICFCIDKVTFTEDDFTHWVRKMPDETLSVILDFDIVPPPLNDEAQKIFSQRHQEADDDPFVRYLSLTSALKITILNESIFSWK